MRPRTSAVALSLLVAGFLGASPSVPAEEKRRLRRPIEIDGVPCSKRARFHDDGHLRSCRLSRDAVVRGQALPARTFVELDSEGSLGCCFLGRDAEIQGHVCRGKGHHYMTCFHPNGRLRFCNLARPEEIDGVPCERATFLIWTRRGNAGVEFHDNGRLEACLLAGPLELQGHSFERNDRIELDRDGKVVPRRPRRDRRR